MGTASRLSGHEAVLGCKLHTDILVVASKDSCTHQLHHSVQHSLLSNLHLRLLSPL